MGPEDDIEVLMAADGTPCGWTGDQPRLSDEQLVKLLAYLPTNFESHQRKNVELIFQNMFHYGRKSRASEAKLTLDGKGKPTTCLVKETERFRQCRTRRNDLLERRFSDMSENAQSIVVELTKSRRNESYRHSNTETPEELLHRLDKEPTYEEMIDELTKFISKPSPARSEPTLRQLIRGLAALWTDHVGELPGRSVISRDHRKVGRYFEGGHFHELCFCLATFIEESLHEDLRQPLTSLRGLVRSELDKLRAELES
jgi:hypothetical protein